MKSIYKLTATRIDKNNKFVIEESFFTSENKANNSMKYLKKYLIDNHSLNENNIEHYNNYNKIQTFIIDNTFNVSLIEHSIKTNILKYI
jgi:predicted patatin/cPLA2 family phospholipase